MSSPGEMVVGSTTEESIDHDLALKRYDIVFRYSIYENTIFWTRAQFFLVANAALFGFVISKLMTTEAVFHPATLRTCLLRWPNADRTLVPKFTRSGVLDFTMGEYLPTTGGGSFRRCRSPEELSIKGTYFNQSRRLALQPYCSLCCGLAYFFLF